MRLAVAIEEGLFFKIMCNILNEMMIDHILSQTITTPYVKNNYDENGVTKPKQYKIGIDTFERAEANLSKEEILAICKFNIDKYNWRKKDQDKEDFQKIIDYANWAIKNL